MLAYSQIPVKGKGPDTGTLPQSKVPLLMDSSERQDQLRALIPIVQNGLRSPHSKRAYATFIDQFLKTNLPFNRMGILHLARLHDKGKSPATMRLIISALRKLAIEAKHAGILTSKEARMARAVPSPKLMGMRQGNWMTQEGARQFVALPNRKTMVGKRDAAMIALLLGCGLRLEESLNFTWDKYRDVGGRMAIVDLVGKGQKYRTVPVPRWAALDLNRWKAEIEALPESVMPKIWRFYATQLIATEVVSWPSEPVEEAPCDWESAHYRPHKQTSGFGQYTARTRRNSCEKREAHWRNSVTRGS